MPTSAEALALAAAAALASCSRVALPEPAYGPHTAPIEQWVEIDAPPPPVAVEEVGQPPSPRHVWVDGQWIYQPLSRRWTWQQGAFCIPPPGALYYARPEVKRFRKAVEGEPLVRWNEAMQRFERIEIADDRFLWAEGRFYITGERGRPVPGPAAACAAAVGFEAPR